jgi:hypothetical protein
MNSPAKNPRANGVTPGTGVGDGPDSWSPSMIPRPPTANPVLELTNWVASKP